MDSTTISLSNRVLWVVGTPNGGTSAVAGVLFHLGVDMGNPPASPPRTYPTFEDARIGNFRMEDGRYDFRGYLEKRIAAAGPGTIPGVKVSSLFWTWYRFPLTLPVVPIFVDRPLELSIRSSHRLWEEERAARLESKIYPEVFLAETAGHIGQLWSAKERLRLLCYKRRFPYVGVNFEELLGRPGEVVRYLVGRLGLPATGEDIANATDFVNPRLVHYQEGGP